MKTFKTKAGTELPVMSLKGKDYLQVAHRLVWFREERPSWRIDTTTVELTEKFALMKATIMDENGMILATAHKREDAGHFGDFIEKAETGALGRALAYVGYGTQFCADELDEGQRIVDAPQDPKVKKITSVKIAEVVNSQPVSATTLVGSGWESYRIPFGKKYKGKTFDEIGMDAVIACSMFIMNKEQKSTQELEFQNYADEWIRFQRNKSTV